MIRARPEAGSGLRMITPIHSPGQGNTERSPNLPRNLQAIAGIWTQLSQAKILAFNLLFSNPSAKPQAQWRFSKWQVPMPCPVPAAATTTPTR